MKCPDGMAITVFHSDCHAFYVAQCPYGIASAMLMRNKQEHQQARLLRVWEKLRIKRRKLYGIRVCQEYPQKRTAQMPGLKTEYRSLAL